MVIGSLLGIFVADLLSHLTVHSKLPTGDELHHMIAVSADGLGVLVTPLLLLTAAGLGLWSTAVALGWAVVVLVVSLMVVGYLAIRRLEIPLRHKVAIMFAEVVLEPAGDRARTAGPQPLSPACAAHLPALVGRRVPCLPGRTARSLARTADMTVGVATEPATNTTARNPGNHAAAGGSWPESGFVQPSLGYLDTAQDWRPIHIDADS